jgi:hypothetical protein
VASPHAFVAGATGSGKSTLLRTYLLPPVPRALILDQLGDPAWEAIADHPTVTTTSAAIRALGAGHRRVILTVATDDLQAEGGEWHRLAKVLAPDTPDQPSLGRALGGLTVATDEADLLAPNGRTPGWWQSVWRRGRHHGVGIYAATQRASAVDRLVSAQSEVVISCQQHEPLDRKYLGAIWPPDVGAALDHLAPFGALQWEASARRASLLAPDGPGQYVVTATWVPLAGWTDPPDPDDEDESED